MPPLRQVRLQGGDGEARGGVAQGDLHLRRLRQGVEESHEVR